MKKKIIIATCLIFLAFLSISTIYASENITQDDLSSSDVESADVESVSVNDDVFYESNDSSCVQENAVDKLEFANQDSRVDNESCDENSVQVNDYAKLKSSNSSEPLKAKVSTPVKVASAKIIKKPAYLTAFKWISTTKSYALLKVKVLDKNGILIKEGNVKFGIDGKFYNVKVVGGVASKKIILKKAGTYTYSALFSSKNYKDAIKHSKAYVKKAKNKYLFYCAGLCCKLTYNQYLKLLSAKNYNREAYIGGILVNNGYCYKPVYKGVSVKKTKWLYKTVLSHKSVSSSDWSSSYYHDYPLDKYFAAGWHICGWKYVEADHGHVYASYAKLKKKVTYTETNRYLIGYNEVKGPAYMYVESIPKDALIKKGDYVRVWVDTGIDMGEQITKKIDLYTLNP